MRLALALLALLLVAPVAFAAHVGPRTESHRFFGKPPFASYCDETLQPDTLNSGAACFYLQGSHRYTINATRESGLAGPGPVYARYVVFGFQVIWESGYFCGEVSVNRGGYKIGVFLQDAAPASCGGLPQTADIGNVTVTFYD